jgi:ATP-binding cassette subfamily C protein CydD
VLTTRARRRISAAIACGTIAGALAVVQFILLGRAVDDVFLGGRSLADLRPGLTWLAATAIGRGLVSWVGEVLAHSAAGVVKVSLRDGLVAAILRRGPRGVAGERAGELTHILVGGVEAVEAYVSQYLPQVALAGTVPLLVLMVVLALDPLSAVVLIATGPLIPLFMYLIGGAARERTRRQFVTLSRLSARFLDAIHALPMLKAFGRAADESAAIARASERFRAITMSVLRVAFLSALALELLATIGVALVAVEVGLRLLYGRIAFRSAFTVLLLAPEFYRPLRNLGSAFHAGLAGREALARIRDLNPEHAGATAPVSSSPPQAAPPATPPAVSMRGLSFAYRDIGPPALRDVDLEIPPGRTLALVGPSGSGKTTIARLLLRFLDPDAGVILVDGQPLDGQHPDEWRRRVAWVPQQPYLFHGTVIENLLIARPGASMAEVERALSKAHAGAFVRQLPRGLDTPVGERGQRLSGGQAQRIALARAFLKDAPLLILDEPTAQLDPENEQAVRESMALLCAGRSVLLIAHRLTTVTDADRIAVLAEGRVVEHGTQRELVESGGRYAAMVAAYGGLP